MRRSFAAGGLLAAVAFLTLAVAEADPQTGLGQVGQVATIKPIAGKPGDPNLVVTLGPAGKSLEMRPDLAAGVRYWFFKPQPAADGPRAGLIWIDPAKLPGPDDPLPSATYRLSAVAIDGDVTPNPPTPPVPPPPVPPKPPTPIGWSWLIVVAESSTLPTAAAQLLDDPDLLAAVRARSGNDLQRVDPSSPGSLEPYATYAQGKAEPYAIMIMADGLVVWEGPFPTDKPAALALIGKATGSAK